MERKTKAGFPDDDEDDDDNVDGDDGGSIDRGDQTC